MHTRTHDLMTGKNRPCCNFCGKVRNVKKVITDETLVSYICGQCNITHARWITQVSHEIRHSGF